MQIIDGYCDVPNIYADDIGEYNISLFGAGDYVLAVGEKLGYELISNNELRIKDGIFLTQGRRGIIKKGSSELCIIENGTQAEKRNDLVVIEYARDEATQVESHRLKVLKGTPGEDAADPEAVTGDISSGAVLHQMPLYRVRLDGLNVVAVEPLFEIGNVSPETVDPVTATEEGFAADAKLTGDALRDLSANLQWVSVKWPDYGSATQITPFPQSYTATEDCWFVVSIQRNSITGKGTTFQMFIENTLFDAFSFSDIKENTQDIYISMTRMFPLRQGNTVKFVNDGWKTPRLTVIPCK